MNKAQIPKYTVKELNELIKTNKMTPKIVKEVTDWYMANINNITIAVEYAFNRTIQDMMKSLAKVSKQ